MRENLAPGKPKKTKKLGVPDPEREKQSRPALFQSTTEREILFPLMFTIPFFPCGAKRVIIFALFGRLKGAFSKETCTYVYRFAERAHRRRRLVFLFA